MVIHDLDRGRSGLAIRPAEAYSPLPVDTNGILPPPTGAQRLQSVAGQSPNVAPNEFDPAHPAAWAALVLVLFAVFFTHRDDPDPAAKARAAA